MALPAVTGTSRTQASSKAGRKPAEQTTPPAETAVTVLNGTETDGLAHRASPASCSRAATRRRQPPYGRPPGANEVTVVEYASGQQADAEAVAHSLSGQPCAADRTAVAALARLGQGGRDRRRGQGRESPIAAFLDIPARSAKPREHGITHVIDRGMSVAEVDGLLEVAGDSVDIVKLGWGTALVSANLERQAGALRRATASRSCSAAR